MKKHLNSLMIVLMAVTMIFFACKKEPDTPVSVIKAKDVINGNSDIVTVKAVMEHNVTWDEEVVATGSYEKNGFALTLPKEVPDKYLSEVGDEVFEFEEWVTISDPKAKVGVAWFNAYNKNDKEIGYFYYLGISTKYYVDAMYIYSDRNFTVKGKFEEKNYSEEVDCSFKKGWNIVYMIEGTFEEKYMFTTKNKTDVKMEWVFDDYYYYDYAYVRFIKEGNYPNCIAMGVGNDYCGTLAFEYFGEDAGTTCYNYIPQGTHYTFHWDVNNTEIIDITDYIFEEESAYSVICSEKNGELQFSISKDDDFKINKNTLNLKRKTTIAKKRAVSHDK